MRIEDVMNSGTFGRQP